MPSNVIFLFENAPKVTLDFTQAHLGPTLDRLGKSTQTAMQFIDYLDRTRSAAPLRNAVQVAKEACARWYAARCQRTVLVVDLDAKGSDTSDGTFGLKVLRELSGCLGFQTIQELLAHQDFLTTILTVFGHRLPQSFTTIWGALPGLDVVKRLDPPTGGNLNTRLRSQQPRIVVADRGSEAKWLADLIADWI
jgi:hypothetical protein